MPPTVPIWRPAAGPFDGQPPCWTMFPSLQSYAPSAKSQMMEPGGEGSCLGSSRNFLPRLHPTCLGRLKGRRFLLLPQQSDLVGRRSVRTRPCLPP